MSKDLDEAYAKNAKCVSLHCTASGRDALYDLQLVPEELSAGIRYSVYAQYGRYGKKLTRFNHCYGESFVVAAAKYVDVREEKMRKKSYDVAGLARESIACQGRIAAAKRATEVVSPAKATTAPPERPDWPGFEAFVAEATAHLEYKWSSKSATSIPTCAVALADLAFSTSEGLSDAILLVKAATSDSTLMQAFSQETRDWLATRTTDAAPLQLRSLASLL